MKEEVGEERPEVRPPSVDDLRFTLVLLFGLGLGLALDGGEVGEALVAPASSSLPFALLVHAPVDGSSLPSLPSSYRFSVHRPAKPIRSGPQ